MFPTTFRGPVGLAVGGVILLIVAAAVDALLPALHAVAAILSTVGGIAIGLAVIWAIIALLLYVTRGVR